jgi:superfamily II DNA or RNA helicase
VLLNIFNGQHDRLPLSIQEQLKGLPYKNLYGEIASVMMITAAATEGISLRNVRRVLIMEPFWNMVRMDQVIGRAVRAGSHLELPYEDRTVDVFVYTASLTDKQLENDFTLKTKDDGMSSDESIMAVAERKNRIIEQFLTMIKSSAIDCAIHSNKNKPLENGFRCYAFPINMDKDSFSYIPDIVQDEAPKTMRNMRTRTIKAKVVMVKNKKYIAFGDPPQLYDYVAYKDAGVLIPANL